MSRRITVFVLAATATLIATQASADRECFEDSCRVTEAETSAMQPPAAVGSPEPEASAAAPAPAPIKALPQVIATPLVPAPSPPTVRTEEPSISALPVTAQASAPRAPARLAPRLARQERPPTPAPAPVHAADAASDDVRAERVEPREPVYRPRRAAPLPVGAIAVAAPGAVYAEDDMVRVYPNPRHDPAWKLCQLDSRERDQRRCGAYSYHPFGANGYRPYGVYGAERAVQFYVVAPNAKIIPVDSDD